MVILPYQHPHQNGAFARIDEPPDTLLEFIIHHLWQNEIMIYNDSLKAQVKNILLSIFFNAMGLVAKYNFVVH
jgi:hypothetical protein